MNDPFKGHSCKSWSVGYFEVKQCFFFPSIPVLLAVNSYQKSELSIGTFQGCFYERFLFLFVTHFLHFVSWQWDRHSKRNIQFCFVWWGDWFDIPAGHMLTQVIYIYMLYTNMERTSWWNVGKMNFPFIKRYIPSSLECITWKCGNTDTGLVWFGEVTRPLFQSGLPFVCCTWTNFGKSFWKCFNSKDKVLSKLFLARPFSTIDVCCIEISSDSACICSVKVNISRSHQNHSSIPLRISIKWSQAWRLHPPPTTHPSPTNLWKWWFDGPMPGKVASMLLGVLNSVESPKVRWPRGCFVDKMIAWIPGDIYGFHIWTQTCVKKTRA